MTHSDKYILYLLLGIFCCYGTTTLGQQKEAWIAKPKEAWPSIAMVNEVWYQNGERYVHPSFQYAATGFLLDTGKDTLAITAKHVLWIAKMKAMKSVDFKGNLQKWLMHPKNKLADSVIVDRLINADSTEVLEGRQSSITQRDWLVFTTKYHSPNIQPLKPRFTPVKPGEKVFMFACPYKESTCVVYQGKVIESTGNRLYITSDTTQQVGGASGSPIVDENGFLIGILGGSSVNRFTGEPAFYGISTHYLEKVLLQEKPLNVPLISIGDYLLPIIEQQGIRKAVIHFQELYHQPKSHFTYDFSSEQLNKLGDLLMKSNQVKEAIKIYDASLSTFKWNYNTYNSVGKAYIQLGKKKLAQQAYRQAIKLNPKDQTAVEALQKL